MGREVAIKQLTQFDEPGSVARFLAEARTAGNLHHRNIVTIHESGEYEGKPYIVMELLEGETLQQLIERHAPISLLDKLRIMLQVAEGLAFAHERGVIHRDIKPANIMRLSNGDAKIMDFGIARGLGGGDTWKTLQGVFIGTPAYSAPERYNSIDADAASDVFSYGVVVYEFISGQHPFKAIDLNTLIYNLASREPEYSLIELVPECPPASDDLVHRALRKDREMRFQNMGEVVLDLNPVVLELAHEHAGRLIAQVDPLLDQGRVTEAEELLRQARAIDPGNKEARRLHDAIVQQQRKALLRGRVDALILDAEAKLKERRFSEAIQILTSATRLMSDDEVNAKLQRAKEALEANRKAGRLLSEARQQAGAGNIDEAFRLVSSAFSVDPNNPSVISLFRDIKNEADVREAQRQLENTLELVHSLRSQLEFDRALEALSAVPPAYAGSAMVDGLRAEIEAERNDHATRMRASALERAVKKIRGLIQAAQFEKARQDIELARCEFEGAIEIADLFTTLAEKEAAHRQAEQIRKITGTALDLIRARKFAEACSVLEEAHKAYAQDTGISRLLDHTRGLRAADDRARAAAAALERGRSFHAEGRFEEALEVIQRALITCGDHPDLLELKGQVEFDHEQQQSQAAVNAVLKKANELLFTSRTDEAVTELEQALTSFPASQQLIELLEAARRAKAAQEEQEFCTEANSRIQVLESARDLRSAHKIAKQALENYPDNKDLQDVEKRLARTIAEEDRRLEVDRRAAAIKQKLDSGDWRAAAEALEDALQRFADEIRIHSLAEQVRAAQLRGEMADLERSVREDLRNGEAAEAEQLLQNAAPHLREQPAWGALNNELTKHKRYEADLARVEHLRNEGDLETAWLVLEETASYSEVPDRRREDLRQLIRRELADRDRRKSIDLAVVEVKQKLQEGNLPAARAAIQALETQARNNSQILALLSRVEQEERSLERDKRYADALDAAEHASYSGDFSKAEAILRPWMSEAPDTRAGTLLEFVVAKRKEAERKEQLKRFQDSARGLIGKHDYVNAIAELQRARREFPDNTELKRLQGEAERRQSVDEGLLKITELEETGDFESALAEAQRILQAAPGEPDLENAIERLRSALRDKRLTGYNRKIQEAIQYRDWAKAGQLLDAAGREYSGDASLAHLRDLLAAKQRQFALEELLGNVQDCMLRNELELAKDALEHGKEAFGSEPAWNALRVALEHRLAYESALREAEEKRRRGDLAGAESGVRRLATAEAPDSRASVLLKQIVSEQSRREHDEGVRQARAKAASLAGGGDLNAAIDVLDSGIAQYPSDSGLLEDRRALVLRLETNFVNRAVLGIAELQARRDWKAAINTAEEALKRYPDNAELQKALQRIREASEDEQRRSAVGQLVRDIHAAIDARNWSEAEQALKTARGNFPGEGIFDQVAQTLTAARQQAEIDAAVETIRGALAANQLDRALRELATGKKRFPEEEVWRALDEELERYQAYEKALWSASELDRKGKHEQAEAVLRDLISKGGLDSRAALQLQTVAEHRASKERQRSLEEGKSEAARLEKAGRLPETLGLLDHLCAQYPADAELAEQRRRLQARQQQQESEARRADAERRKAAERASRISSQRDGIEVALEASDWDQAARLLAAARSEFPAEQVFQELERELQNNKRQREIEKLSSSVRAAFEARDLDAAARQLAAAQIDFAGERVWQELTKELEARRRYAALVAEGETLIAAGKQSNAAERLEEALKAGSFDDRAQSLLDGIRGRPKRRRAAVVQGRPWLAYVIGMGALLAAGGVAFYLFFSTKRQLPPPQLDHDRVTWSYEIGSSAEQLHETVHWRDGSGWRFRVVSKLPSWLSVTPQSGDNLEQLDVTANPSGLEPKPYSTSISVEAGEEASKRTFEIAVNLNVTKAPAPQVSAPPPPEWPIATPNQVNLKCMSNERDKQTVQWTGSKFGFEAKWDQKWLVVRPRSGISLDRFEVVADATGLQPQPHPYRGQISVDLKDPDGRVVRTVPLNVAFEVRATPVPPAPLGTDPSAVGFDYAPGVNSPPEVRSVRVLNANGSIQIKSKPPWLMVQREGSSLKLSIDTKNPPQKGSEDTVLIADGRSTAYIKVTLSVREKVVPPPAATPAPPGCETRYGGDPKGTFTWEGELPDKGVLELDSTFPNIRKGGGGIRAGDMPNRWPLVIELIQPKAGITIERRPQKDNKCDTLRLQNTSGRALRRITVQWTDAEVK
jgi:hypothetical protein